MSVTVSSDLRFVSGKLNFRRWYLKLARGISRASAPPLVTLVTAALLEMANIEHRTWTAFGCFASMTVVVPALLVLLLWVKGFVSDFDLTARHQRFVPLLASTLCSLLACWTLSYLAPSSALTCFAGAQSICLALLTVISLFWKISIHASAASVLVTVSVAQFGLPAAGLISALGVIGWSRFVLGKHTVMQFVSGCGLGPLAFAIVRIF